MSRLDQILADNGGTLPVAYLHQRNEDRSRRQQVPLRLEKSGNQEPAEVGRQGAGTVSGSGAAVWHQGGLRGSYPYVPSAQEAEKASETGIPGLRAR